MFCFCFVPKGGANEHPYVSMIIVNNKHSSKKPSKKQGTPDAFFPPISRTFQTLVFFQLECLSQLSLSLQTAQNLLNMDPTQN